MKYYTKEIQTEQGVQRTAGIKARDDIESILNKNGYVAIEVDAKCSRKKMNSIRKLLQHFVMKKEWDRKLSKMKKDDILVIQFPVINHTIFLYKSLKQVKKRGAKIILLVHDLETFRAAIRKDTSVKEKVRLNFEEKSLLKLCDKIVVHNEKMKQNLISNGYSANKMVSLEIFDYLIPEFNQRYAEKETYVRYGAPVIIAGTLRPHKAQYVYHLPTNYTFNLYGVGYEAEQQANVHYFGSFPPNELPFSMVGSFGLVWDGEVADTCSGTYGEYLKINNPHKTSLYLASGVPVIIWKKAALADFVIKNKCGIVIDSLDEIHDKVGKITKKEYDSLKTYTMIIGEKLRNGYFTSNAIERCL